MRNPFKHQEHTPEQVDAAWAERGWGTKVERAVPRSTGSPLRFVVRMPSESRCIEVSDLAAAAQDAPAWLDGRSEALREFGRQAGAVLIGAVCDQGELTDVLFTITVAFSEQVEGPVMQIEPPDPATKVVQHVTQLDDATTRVERISALTLPSGETTGLVVDQYLMRTGFGGLAVAFSTSHSGMGGGRGAQLFQGILKTVELTEAEPGTPG
jgi:hypothetical protein